MKAPPDVRLTAINRCIYCGKDGHEFKLSEEHIIPLSFGGNLILPFASCKCCSDVTGAIEGHVAGKMLRALRVHQEVPTRNPQRRPTHLETIEGKTPHEAPRRLVPAADAPGVVTFPIFDVAGILTGAVPSAAIKILGHVTNPTTLDAMARSKKLEGDGKAGALAVVDYEPSKFARVLAKIAHSHVIAHLSTPRFSSFRPLLTDIILGGDPCVSYFVGGTPGNRELPVILPAPSENSLHEIATDVIGIHGKGHIFVQIRLFSNLESPTPVYTVVAGELS